MLPPKPKKKKNKKKKKIQVESNEKETQIGGRNVLLNLIETFNFRSALARSCIHFYCKHFNFKP